MDTEVISITDQKQKTLKKWIYCFLVGLFLYTFGCTSAALKRARLAVCGLWPLACSSLNFFHSEFITAKR
jgi:hypothetical protein